MRLCGLLEVTAVHRSHIASVPGEAGITAALLQRFAPEVTRNAHAARLRIFTAVTTPTTAAAATVMVMLVIVVMTMMVSGSPTGGVVMGRLLILVLRMGVRRR